MLRYVASTGYLILTALCAIAVHRAHAQARRCDTQRIVDKLGKVPASWQAFTRPPISTLNYATLMIMSVTIVPVRATLIVIVHLATLVGSLVLPAEVFLQMLRMGAKFTLTVLGIELVQRGQRLSGEEAPTLVSNHVSFLDIYALVGIGEPLSFVAKQGIEHMFFAGPLSKLLDCVYVSRAKCADERAAVLDAIAAKQKRVLNGSSKYQLCVFAEGTTSNGTSLMKFKPGAFESKLPVQPVLLRYSSQHCSYTCLDMPCHMTLLMAAPPTQALRCVVEWLPKVTASPDIPAQEFADQVRKEIANGDTGPLTLDDSATLKGHFEVTDFFMKNGKHSKAVSAVTQKGQ